MAKVKLEIQIPQGNWRLNVIRSEDDQTWELSKPNKSCIVADLADNEVYPVFVNIAAQAGTEFVVKVDGKEILKDKTNSKNVWTGHDWILT